MSNFHIALICLANAYVLLFLTVFCLRLIREAYEGYGGWRFLFWVMVLIADWVGALALAVAAGRLL